VPDHLDLTEHLVLRSRASSQQEDDTGVERTIVVEHRDRLPWALMELHRELAPDAPVELTFRRAPNAEPFGDVLGDVLEGAGFVLATGALAPDAEGCIRVRAKRALTLPDFVGPDLRVLLCGLNPSEYAADVGVGFARPGNRFWPAALAAGIVTRDRDPRDALLAHGIGMTDLVKRATPRADALSKDEYRAGAARLERLVGWLAPKVVCFVGLSGYRAAIDRRAVAGVQASRFGGATAYVMPNPSGVNGHVTVDDLAEHLRAAAALGA
jgi:TDG/mug DNA glycosylase family protein